MTGRRIAISIVVTLGVVILGGSIGVRVWTQTHPCDVPNLPIPDWRSLSCHAETHLHYPGSQLVTTGGTDERSNGFEQPQRATFDDYWGLNGTDHLKVEMWFGDELASRGWSTVAPMGTASLDWSRGREHFVLFILGSEDYVVTTTPGFGAFALPYQTRYYIDPFGPTSWLF